MSYDAYPDRRLGVDPNNWRWFNMNYDRYRIVDPDPHATELKMVEVVRVKPLLFSAFLLALIIYAYIFLISASTPQTVAANLFSFLIVLAAGVGANSRRKSLKVIGFIILGLVELRGIATIFVYTSLPLSVLAITYGFISWMLGRLLRISTYRTGKIVERAVRIPPHVLWNDPRRRTFGRAGGVAGAVGKFGKKNVDAGVEGEQLTEMLLSYLMKIPGTTVYHGLKFPNSLKSDVDHAVAHGNTVYLIDSKKWRGNNTYDWQMHPKYGEQVTTANGFGRSNHMDAAAEGYRRILGPGVTVVPVIVFHGRNISIGSRRWSTTGVGLFTPHEVMDFMGERISASMPQWRDNVVLRGKLIGNLK